MIEWLFLSHQPQRTITTYITGLCHLIIKGRERTQQLFGHDPAFIHVPLTQVYLQHLATQSLEFQCAIADSLGGLEINLPSDRLLQNIPFLQIRLAEKVSPTPITGARTVFLHGSGKPGRAAIALQEGKNWKNFVSSGHSSTQRVELFAAIMALWQWPQEPLNIVSDSGYTLYTILHLDQPLIKTSIDPKPLIFDPTVPP